MICVNSRGECAAWDLWVEMPVGLSNAVVTRARDEIRCEITQHLQFFGLDTLDRPRRCLSGQHTEDGEAVDDVFGTDADHGDATPRGNLNQALKESSSSAWRTGVRLVANSSVME